MEDKTALRNFGFIVEGVLLVTVGCVGVIGNLLCLITFSRMSVQKNFHRLMQTLAIFDLIYIISSIMLFSVPNIYPWVYSSSVFKNMIPVILPTIHIGLTGSIYLTVAIALERYTTVCHPFFKLSHSWSVFTYIIPICLFSVLYNVPKFLELEVNKLNITKELGPEFTNTTEVEMNSTMVIEQEKVGPTSLRINPTYIKVYIIYLNLIVNGIIPLLLLLFLNTMVYRQLRLYRTALQPSGQLGAIQQKEIRLSQVSLGIVIIFILCHSLRWIPNLWELKQAGRDHNTALVWPNWIEYITHLSHLFTTLNSSANFFVYLLKHPGLFFKAERQQAGAEPMTQQNGGTVVLSEFPEQTELQPISTTVSSAPSFERTSFIDNTC